MWLPLSSFWRDLDGSHFRRVEWGPETKRDELNHTAFSAAVLENSGKDEDLCLAWEEGKATPVMPGLQTGGAGESWDSTMTEMCT